MRNEEMLVDLKMVQFLIQESWCFHLQFFRVNFSEMKLLTEVIK